MNEHPTIEDRLVALQVEMAETRADHRHLDDCVDGLKVVVNDRFDKTSAKIDRIADKLDNRIDRITWRFYALNALVAGIAAGVTAHGISILGG